MNRQLFVDIKSQLLIVNGLKYVAQFNNQIAHIKSRDQFSFPLPAAFIEFLDPSPQQYGGGVQIYEPLNIRIHWAWEKYNEDGEQDEVLEQFDIVQFIQAKFQNFAPANASTFVRINELYDGDHDNISVGYVDFRTTYVDRQQELPLNSIQSIPPTEPIIII